jgi:methylmalonyl-CoA mutase N-terminal domain/subunit
MSFFFACHNNFIEEVSKFRAARQLWYELVEKEFSPKNPKSSQLRFHTQTSGVTLTAQQPLNNAIRVAYQALSAVLGGTQSLHTNSFDEALGLPTENSARLALRTQQIIAEELGITEHVDPLGGSPTIEETTDDLILQARSIIHDIENMGGAMECVKAGLQQRIIHESAWDQLSRVEKGLELVVGVNTHVDEEEPDFEGLVLDSSEANSKISHLIEMKTNRNNKSVNDSLIELRKCCRNGSNVMYPIISAVKAEATVGEVNTILREEFGTWVAPSGV